MFLAQTLRRFLNNQRTSSVSTCKDLVTSYLELELCRSLPVYSVLLLLQLSYLDYVNPSAKFDICYGFSPSIQYPFSSTIVGAQVCSIFPQSRTIENATERN